MLTPRFLQTLSPYSVQHRATSRAKFLRSPAKCQSQSSVDVQSVANPNVNTTRRKYLMHDTQLDTPQSDNPDGTQAGRASLRPPVAPLPTPGARGLRCPEISGSRSPASEHPAGSRGRPPPRGAGPGFGEPLRRDAFSPLSPPIDPLSAMCVAGPEQLQLLLQVPAQQQGRLLLDTSITILPWYVQPRVYSSTLPRPFH